MEYISINAQKVCYDLSLHKKSDKLYVFLHGWGGSKKSFQPLAQRLSNNNSTLIFDWPGFGDSEPPKTAWDTHKYAEFFSNFLDTLDLQQTQEIILYGHSFGCRVIVRYINEQKYSSKISQLVFTGAAGVVFPLPWHKKLIKKISKLAQPIKKIIPQKVQSFIRRKVLRAHDWDATKGIMKQTFLKVISEPGLREDLKKINIPSVIIWGKNDTYTPLKAAFIFKKNLQNVQKFHVFPDGKHGIHHTHQNHIFKILTKQYPPAFQVRYSKT